jgi:hypothetical protein
MSTQAPAPDRRFRTMIRRKLAITAGAVLVGGVLAGGALAAAPAQASDLSDTVQLLGHANPDAEHPALSHNIHNADNSYQGWSTVEGNGGAAYFDVALGGAVNDASIAALPDGSTQSVAIGEDGNLYHNIRYAGGGWQGWVAVKGNGGAKYFNGTDPSITGLPNANSQLIETGDDGNLYFNIRYADGNWQGWAALPGIAGAKYFSDQSASITGMPDGSSQLIAVQSGSGETYHNIRYANGGWQGWIPVEGESGSKTFDGRDPSITGMPDGSSQLIEQDLGGTLMHNIRFSNGGWQGWIPVDGLYGSDSIWTGTGVIASLPDGSSQVFARQQDDLDTTYVNTRNINGGWSGWTLVPGPDQVVAAAGFGSVS